MESSDSEPLPTSRAETELSNARKTVRDLALKIEESNSRAKSMQQKQQTNLKQHEQQEHEVYLKNKEDYQYAQVMKELERIKQELGKLKLDMKRILKGKKQAENSYKVSSSKNSMLSSAVERIKKEVEEIDEEHVLVELARIEVVKERQTIEAQIKQEAYHYQTQLEEVKKKVKDVDQHKKLEQELQLTLHNINLLNQELARAKETTENPDSLHTITEQLEAAKTELANIKREGVDFMTSIDVIRNELKLVQEETARLEKEEEKQELTIQILNSKILNGKANLESVTATTENANLIASNLSLAVDQLKAETETVIKERDLIIEEIKKIKLEIPKTESEIELSEKRLEAAMEELKAAKSSEFTALENLKNLIDSTVQSRELTSQNKSTIKITNFEYEYLTRKAGGAEEIADKKVAAAQAWVEALKANEKEILMKIKMAKQEINKLHMEVDDDVTVVASPRRSMYKIGNMTPGKRVRSQKFLSPATRQAIRSASFSRKREKATRSLAKLLDENDEMGE
ncbi:protein PLASTID MOVEMENT IMPAIRED 2-like [Bidens hawaiensis]|uniref:protein PLASTID MOVEMENT IMPAIRED 2-like n=1 Tax=Bidens hawaiensis TaxID=980011 RepID=UPI00404B8394